MRLSDYYIALTTNKTSMNLDEPSKSFEVSISNNHISNEKNITNITVNSSSSFSLNVDFNKDPD